ncbi:MAG: hypothetical protein AAGG02_03740 [Cyanobacteria bacterium P01_H01_bin.15]
MQPRPYEVATDYILLSVPLLALFEDGSSMSFSTQDLIKILDNELKAIWRGERQVLSCEERLNSPAIAKALNLRQVNKVFAFQDFQRQIHDYQQEHHVSGIIWRELTCQGQTLTVPELHNKLIPVEGDKQTLMAAKSEIFDFWKEKTQDMVFFLEDSQTTTTAEYADYLLLRADWVELDIGIKDFYLGLCWGDPTKYRYRWARPSSGRDRITATPKETDR